MAAGLWALSSRQFATTTINYIFNHGPLSASHNLMYFSFLSERSGRRKSAADRSTLYVGIIVNDMSSRTLSAAGNRAAVVVVVVVVVEVVVTVVVLIVAVAVLAVAVAVSIVVSIVVAVVVAVVAVALVVCCRCHESAAVTMSGLYWFGQPLI